MDEPLAPFPPSNPQRHGRRRRSDHGRAGVVGRAAHRAAARVGGSARTLPVQRPEPKRTALVSRSPSAQPVGRRTSR